MKNYEPCKKNFIEITTKHGTKSILNIIGISHIDISFMKKDDHVIIYMIKDSTNQDICFDVSAKEFLNIKDSILAFEVRLQG